MKTFKSPSGPFVEQPYYTPNDVEAICSDELQKLGFYPSDPSPVRIDRFIEKRFDLQPIKANAGNQKMVLVESGIQGQKLVQTTREKQRTRNKDERERDLEHH